MIQFLPVQTVSEIKLIFIIHRFITSFKKSKKLLQFPIFDL